MEDMDGGGMARCSPSGRPSIVCDVAFCFAASRVENYSTNIEQKKNIMHPFLNLSCLVLRCNPCLLCLTLCGNPKFLNLLGLQCHGMLLCNMSSDCNHGFFSLQFHIHYGFPVVSLLASFLFSFCFLVIGLLTNFSFSFCFQFNNWWNASIRCPMDLQRGLPELRDLGYQMRDWYLEGWTAELEILKCIRLLDHRQWPVTATDQL